MTELVGYIVAIIVCHLSTEEATIGAHVPYFLLTGLFFFLLEIKIIASLLITSASLRKQFPIQVGNNDRVIARRQQLVTKRHCSNGCSCSGSRAINNPHMHSIKRCIYDSRKDGTVSICYIIDLTQGVTSGKAFFLNELQYV